MAVRAENDPALSGGTARSGGYSETVLSVEARAGTPVAVPGGRFLSDASYLHQGDDLVLIGPDGTTVIVRDYFLLSDPPDLVSPEGGRVAAALVRSFTPPEASGQVAQAGAQVAQAAQPIGRVQDLTGEAFAVHADGTRVALSAGDPVYQGDVIETGAGGAVGLLFVDDTTFALGDSARLALDELVYNPATQQGESAFSILKGVFVFTSGQIAHTDNTKMTVTTPVATIGIRGTKVAGEVNPPGVDSKFTVIDGEIAIVTGGGTVVMTDHNATTFVSSFQAPPSEPVIFSPSELEANYNSVSSISGGLGSSSSSEGGSHQHEGVADVAPAAGESDGEGSGGGGEGDVVSVTGGALSDQAVQEALVGGEGFSFGEQLAQDASTSDGGDTGETFTLPPDLTVVVPPAEVNPVVEFVVSEFGLPITFDGRNATAPQSFSGGDAAEQIFGSAFDDTLSGVGGGDVIFGGPGNDTISGGDGNDFLVGSDGNDSVFGGAGNDILIAASGAGNDIYNGGSGSDTAVFSSATNPVTVNLANGTASGVDIDSDVLISIENVVGGAGNDTIVTSGAANTVSGGLGDDTIVGSLGFDVLSGSAGTDTLSFSGVSDGLRFDLAAHTVSGAAPSTGGLVQAFEPSPASLVTLPVDVSAAGVRWFDLGSQGELLGISDATDANNSGDHYDDAFGVRVGGTAYAAPAQMDQAGNTFTGDVQVLGGLDVVVSFDFDNTLPVARQIVTLTNTSGSAITTDVSWINNTGADSGQRVVGTSSGDLLFTTADRHLVTSDGDTGNNLEVNTWALFGPDSPEVTPASVSLLDGETNFGFAGDQGMRAEYNVTVGAGETKFLMWFGGVNDTNQAGLDLATIFDDTTNSQFQGLISDLSPAQLAATANWTLETSFDTVFNSFEVFAGGSGDDVFVGSAASETILGNGGNDTIFGSSGSDFIDGGSGTNVLIYDIAGVTVDLEAGTVSGAGFVDTFVNIAQVLTAGDQDLIGTSGDDTLTGGLGNDLIDGADGNDTLDGSAGNDVILGGNGDDLLSGGDGNDTLTGAAGNDLVDGGAGNDMLIAATGTGDDTYIGGSGIDTAVFSSATNPVFVNLLAGIASGVDIDSDLLNGIENVTGGAGDDTLIGDQVSNGIIGGTGDDTISGVGGDDILSGGDGNDFIDGGGGDDVISGGLGNDTLQGAFGADLIAGGDGDDLVLAVGDVSNDTFDGGAGTDTIDYSNQDATVTIDLSAGTASSGGSANPVTDTLIGFEVAIGGAGNDVLIGSAAGDTLDGGAGDDTLTGGAGNDVVSGGAGNDTLAAGSDPGNDSYDGGAGFDTLDFSSATNALVIDAGGGSSGTGDPNLVGLYTFDNGNSNNEVSGTNALPDLSVGSVDFSAGDAIFNNSFDFLELPTTLGANPFTIYIDATYDPQATVAARLVSQLNTNLATDTDFLIMQFPGTDLSSRFFSAEGNGNNVTNGAIDGARHTIAFTWDGSTTGLFFDGTLQTTAATGTLPDIDGSVVRFGNRSINDGIGATGSVHEIRIFDAALSEADLNAIQPFVSQVGTATGIDIGSDTFENIERIVSGSGDDTITAGSAGVTIEGGAGNDILNSGAGDDVIFGGEGNDTIANLLGEDGNDNVNGGAGFSDILRLDRSSSVGTLSVTRGAADTVLVQDAGTTQTVSDVERILVVNNSGPITATVSGDFSGTALGIGNSSIEFSGGQALNIDASNTTNANVTAAGSIQDDVFVGGAGLDTFSAFRGGNDTFEGRDGNDTVVFASRLGLASVTGDGGAGSRDQLQLQLGATNNDILLVTSNSETGSIDFSINGIASTVTNFEFFNISDASANTNDILSITFDGDFSASLGGTIQNVTAFNAGQLVLDASGVTSATPFSVNSGGGDDLISTAAGDDFISAGAGADTIDGGAGADTLHGDAGNDTLVFDAADNQVDGGLGDDTLLLTGGLDLDLTSVDDSRFTSIESIVFDGAGQSTLTVAASDVQAMSSDNTLSVLNGAGTGSVHDDTVQLDGVWNFEGSTGGVHHFQFGQAELDTDATTLTGLGSITVDTDATLGFANSSDLMAVTGSFDIIGTSTLTVDTGTLHIQAGAFFNFGTGTVTTSGTGVFQNDGTLSGGNSPGTAAVDGDFSLGHAATFLAELGGTAPGIHDGYDQLIVSGELTAAGTIDVTEFGGFDVSVGDSFDVVNAGTLTGSFDDITGLDVGGGVVLDAVQIETGVTLTGKAVTHQGTAADDTLTGGSGNDVFSGGDGGDVIVGGGGADLMHGGAGDDVFVAADTGFGRIDGGDGFDTVRFAGEGQSFDLTGLRGDQLSGIEAFDLTGNGGNTLTLDADTVFAATRDTNAQTGTDYSLIIDGEAGDVVEAGAGWSNTGTVTVGGDGYSVYESDDNGAQLYVHHDVAVHAA